MKILHVVPTYLPATRYGGPIYSVHALCTAIARMGHTIEVFTTNVDGLGESPVPTGTPVDRDGVKVTYFRTGSGRRLYRSPDMGRAFADQAARFDVIHIHSVFLWPTVAAARAARRAGVPYVISPRGMLVGDLIRRKSRFLKTAWIALFERSNLAGAASIHVTSQIEADELRKLGLPARRVDVIANGIDLPPHSTKGVGVLPDALSRPIVLSLGRINWKKGLDRLIPSMKFVPGASLVIAGNDEENYKPLLENLARLNGVADRVHFIGEVRDNRKWNLFAAADVFALPSYSENFGIAVLEAMVSGVPVVVTPEVGLAPTLAGAGAGLVVNGEPQVLGEAIARMLANVDERRTMGAAGRRAAAEHFSWDAIARHMVDVYAHIARGTDERV